MTEWQPDLYLDFERERTQPAIDLAARIDLADPSRIIDLGCGPGNSTAVLGRRWPAAEITGLDSSAAMVDRARTSYPQWRWIQADAAGDLSGLGRFDVVFSNAAIQWMPDQGALLGRWLGLVRPGGVLAVQAPNTDHMPIQTVLDQLVATAEWRRRLSGQLGLFTTHPLGHYYDALAGSAGRIEVWRTDYHHVLAGHRDLVRWYAGSGLRPYLARLGETERGRFLEQYEARLVEAYPPQADGRLLFPFTRLFILAWA
ncbi:MAG: methyltransferase domain-containing protein [Propionibacteriaceae bacterium]|jgi:trans-aconitate 2-methyltransferase|nr:methyltransferase domain-containing protein [Propionibacteriaceae bacterium]